MTGIVVPQRVTRCYFTEREGAWLISNGWALSYAFDDAGSFFPLEKAHAALVRCVLQLRVFQMMAGHSI